MDKNYDPAAIEQRWYDQWERAGHFKPSGTGKDPFCIVIPPPNVTGSLHMGHAFNNTVMDLLIRHARMCGRDTLWQVGTDHAGIATQMVVERQLAAEGKSRHDLGREAFLERVWQWKAESGGAITRQLRRLGASCDWSRERFTMDAGLSKAVSEVFVRLHEQGLIYRGKRLVNWDPVLQTAISDLEVVSEEEQGHLWHIRYPLADGDGHLTVATTRPETLLGDTAVAVHPDDERYRHLIGRMVKLPLCDRQIPVIADDYVDPAFGTGCLKITPAHDFNDYAVGERHGLPKINVFTPDARINDAAPAAYQGLDRYQARKRVVADLEAAGLLESVKDHTLMVPRGDRTGAAVEPYLTDQWYVDLTRETLPDGRPGGLAAITRPALEAVRSGSIKLIPDNWEKTYAQWLENIQDWCISRQIWWGHRIPVWYGPDGKDYSGHDEADVRARHALPADLPLRQDEDVLDTWFSSALWPFSTLGWPEPTPELKRYYPTDVLVTGFDIIFFWVARMVMMGLPFAGEVPFRTVYVHGLVRDHEGQKMSKSKGNVLDPLDIIDGVDLDTLIAKRTAGLMQPQMAKKIEQATRKQFPQGIPAYGTDALRFTFASQATLGRDIKFDLARCEGYRNFCTKLWNAARFVLMNTEGMPPLPAEPVRYGPAERWIRRCLAETITKVDAAIAEYRLDYVASALYEFAWGEYCDWYIELAKPVLQEPDADPAHTLGVRRTLVEVLEALLRLAHPLIPFITEEIWQQVAPRAGRGGETIMLAAWPSALDFDQDAQETAEAVAQISLLVEVVRAVRNLRAELNLPPGQAVPVLLSGDGDLRTRLERNEHLLRRLARVASVEWVSDAAAPQAATALVGDLTVRLPLHGLVDASAEMDRLGREIAKLEQAISRAEARLANPAFVDKAPPEVVDTERARLAEFADQRATLAAQRERMATLAG
ncbi:valine--tRNA ligase [Immundisolibacter sp.]|uniref:valine--tRNA ligase n=1 Tax=Immundisolibacter sp. TaxID=1934948 RepID=UPI002B09E976|nr:valine--tRNA ligase [Immundisolibacter sp.]MEA3221188.1 Valine--tRNA ligase [Immundisolibacter sp.]